MIKIVIIFASLLFIASCVTQPPNTDLVPFYQVETAKSYDEVLAELEVAIADHNFRVTGHSRVGKVIRERGATDFPEYDTIQFCNLTLAKQVLEITPLAIGFMPCNIVTYQMQGKTVIKTHLLPEDTGNAELNSFAREMNPQLKQIVDFAASQ
jgi:uncharacterized protein (DUF302 family)